MTTVTVEELQENFEDYVDRCGDGESFLITSPTGNCVMIPVEDYDDLELKSVYKLSTNCHDG